MQDLTLVGVHEDGEHLVLVDAAGQRYRVRVDEPLRAAARRDRARLSQLQIEVDSLRPREIQARIRAGQTAEEVAEAAQVPVEHVRRFEGPVLAEREFVAAQARGVRLRRSGSTITSYTLGELVQQRLGQREIDDTDSSWDAWREEDGSWVVCLSFHAGSTRRRAHWTYDTQLRHVSARDDEARWFTEEERTEITAPGQRRLTPIRDAREPRDQVREVIVGRTPGRPPGRDPRDPGPARSGRDRDREADEPRPAERHPTGSRQLEEYPPDQHPERYEDARYGEDRLREDPYREEVYGEDRPAEVRRATIDLLDTLRERRGRRPHLPPADPPSDRPDVDTAVETLRTRADPLNEDPGAPPPRRQDAGTDPERVELPDEVIELPEDQPARGHPAGGPAAGARGGRKGTPERAASGPQPAEGSQRAGGPVRGHERAGRRGGERTAGGQPAATGKRAGERGTGHRGGSAAPPGERPATTSRPPARGAGSRKQAGGQPSPTVPPAPPAPARERQPTDPVGDGGSGERATSRRNKRASVPSWDDIVFGSRRE